MWVVLSTTKDVGPIYSGDSGVARGGGGRGGSCPRAPPRGGRQNPAKELKKICIRKSYKNAERI